MNCILKTAFLATAIAATTIASMPANAGDRHWRHYGGHAAYHAHYSSGNDLAVAGILGLAAGALVVGLAAQPEPVYAAPYRRPQPVRVYESQAYYGALEPWSDGWYDYCTDRYRSFQPRTGTFTGYDGQQHFCTAD
ncbi:MAG: BA14K family protein [Hyphomicrobiales bacterium]|nr:BA14K family protein [Hyphomicrobiales bacterium]